jgi:Big-like domain-containing protein
MADTTTAIVLLDVVKSIQFACFGTREGLMGIRFVSISICIVLVFSITSSAYAQSEDIKRNIYRQIMRDSSLIQLMDEVRRDPSDRAKMDTLLIRLPISPLDIFRIRMEEGFREYLIPREVIQLHHRWLDFHPQGRASSQNAISILDPLMALSPDLQAASIGTNRNVASNYSTTPLDFQGEIQISVNRNNTNQIVAGANTWDTPSGCDQTQAAFGSIDGGVNWRYTCAPSVGAFGLSCSANAIAFGSDPALNWDNNNIAYFNYMLLCCDISCQFGFANPTSALVVAKSSDAGLTWSGFGTVVNHLSSSNGGLDDKEFYAIDNTPTSPYYGRHYECWDNNNDELFAYSNNGTSWTQVNLPSAGAGLADLGCEMAIQSNGTIHLVWDALTCGASTCSGEATYYTRSINGGQTWSAPVLIKAHNIYGFNNSSKIPPQNSRGINPFGAIDVDNSTAHPGRLYFAYSDVNAGASMATSDIYVTRSDDGINWTGIKVNDDATNTAQFHPFLAVDQINGSIVVGWHDARNDMANNRKIDYYMSRSTDGGVTWEANTKVSQLSAEFNNSGISYSDENTTDNSGYNPNQYGEYLGVDAFNGKAYMAWTDTRHYFPNNTSEVQKENLGFAVVTFSDTTPPTTSITQPTGGSTVSGTINVNADANDNISVTKVEFYVDGTLVGTDTTSPYSVSWNTATVTDGGHDLTSKAYDAANNTGTSSIVSVTVSNADLTLPTTSITSPTGGSTVSGTINVNANANDNIGVTKVEFYVDTSLIGTDTTSPYSVSWNTTTIANGSHNLTSKAYDAANNTGTSSIVSVTVSNSDTTVPTTLITSPTAGANVSGTINVTATATDNVAMKKVDFYLDGNIKLGSDSSSPYKISWNTNIVANGNHNLTSKAFDTSNNSGISPAVTVNVNNPHSCTLSAQIITNGGFESGNTGWGRSSSTGSTTGMITNSLAYSPHTGSWYAKLNGFGTTSTQSITTSSGTMVIPAEACVATFTFWLSIGTAETTTTTANDTVVVQIQTKNNNGNFGSWSTLATFSNLNSTGLNVYAQQSFNLLAYKGKTVKLRFQGKENSSLQTTFLIDDVALNVTQ